MNELKKCPFCNGEAAIEIHSFSDGSRSYGVRCLKCLSQISPWIPTKIEAIERWNRRVSNECFTTP